MREAVIAIRDTIIRFRLPLLLVLLAALIALPPVALAVQQAATDSGVELPALMPIAVFTVIFATFTTSWNIFSGYTGYIALGHAVFFGTGAYTLAILCKNWHVTSDFGPMLLLPVSGLVAAAVAVPVGFFALRTRGHTFVVITIATFFIAQLLAYNLRVITKGTAGLELPIPSWSGTEFEPPFYYVGLILLIAALLTSWWVRRSKYGLGLRAIREDEDRARGLGVRTGSSKLLAFALSAFFVGMAGGLWAYYIESVFPNSAFDALFDVAIALMAFLGGLGTLAGPLLGALILEPVQQTLTANRALTGWSLILFGALFLAVILLLPEGIVPTLRKRIAQWLERRQPPAQAVPDAVPPAAPPHGVATATSDGGDR